MGKYKRRIYPRDVTINVGKGVQVEVPEPYRSQGQKWKEVRTVTFCIPMSRRVQLLACGSSEASAAPGRLLTLLVVQLRPLLLIMLPDVRYRHHETILQDK